MMQRQEQREHRFAVDRTCGRLARWLRLLGHDTLYEHQLEVQRAERLVLEDRRWVVTRNRRLYAELSARLEPGAQGRPGPLLLEADHVRDQLAYLIRLLALPRELRLERCSRCNLPLREAAREEAMGEVPGFVLHTQQRFLRCPSCGRFYWPGTHPGRMEAFLRGL
jgi:hypothetical protein